MEWVSIHKKKKQKKKELLFSVLHDLRLKSKCIVIYDVTWSIIYNNSHKLWFLKKDKFKKKKKNPNDNEIDISFVLGFICSWFYLFYNDFCGGKYIGMIWTGLVLSFEQAQ